MRTWIVIIVFVIANQASAENSRCKYDVVGHWKQTHVSAKLDKELFEDPSQSWELSADNNAVHNGPIKQNIKYECNDDIITLKGMAEVKLKIVRYAKNKMIWESLDFGGFIYVSK